MCINELLEIAIISLDDNDLMELESVNNLLAGCGISNGSGNCGVTPY